MAKIGFIGLGNMGAPMARNLIADGHEVTGYDVAAVEIAGMIAAPSATAAVHGQDIVITMLPNGEIVRTVHARILEAARAGACLIDCSTIDVASARQVHDQAAAAGLLSLDAPVSGGVGGAEAGTLTFMVGGSGEAFAVAEEVLAVMGGKVVHCGGPGAGQIAKICNNMILGISMIAVGEAFNLADELGLDRQSVFDVVSTSSGFCWSMNTYCPVPGVGPVSPADNDYKPGFASALMLKDLLLSQQAADSVGVATPLGRHAADLYRSHVDAGNGETDFSSILETLAAMPRK